MSPSYLRQAENSVASCDLSPTHVLGSRTLRPQDTSAPQNWYRNLVNFGSQTAKNRTRVSTRVPGSHYAGLCYAL